MTTPGKPALGFTILRVPAIQSPNFVAGVSGWQIARDGSAQFNSIVIPPSSAGNTVFTQGTPPVAFRAGDLWVNTASGNAISVWNGSAWVPYQFGTAAIASGSITAALIAANTITAGQLAAGIIYAGIVNGTTINAGTFTGSVFQGTNFIINTAGAFFYSAAPAAGNLIASIASVAGTDGFTNPYKAGVNVYGAASTFVQMVAGTPAMVNLGTGDAAEATPGQATTSIVGIGPTRTLTTRLFAPRVSGEAAGALTEVRLQSPSADLTVSPTFQVIVNDGVNVANLGIFTTGYQFSGGAITSNGGTAANPSLIVTDTWHTLAPVVTGYTVNQCRYRLQPDGTMLFDIQLTAGAGGGTAGTYVLTTTLPVQYQPAGSLARSYPVGYNATLVAGAFFGWLNFDEASSGNAGRVRLQIPGLAATSMIGTTAVVPLN